LRPLDNTVILGCLTAGHEIQHDLKKVGKRLGNSSLLNDEAIQRVLLLSAVNDSVDGWANWLIGRWESPAYSVGVLIRIVPTAG
jgi:hypothetical protein